MSEEKSKQQLVDEIARLKETLKQRECTIEHLLQQVPAKHCLSNEEISRYSRQMFVDIIGVNGQEKIKSSKVLIIGCGGLGCPSAQYLASTGVGTIGLIDYDEVELNNLHRQVLHTEQGIGIAKVDSLAAAINRLNSNVIVEKHKIQISSSNALDIIKRYDIIIDATDNVATRYLLNDACVLSSKVLVSGAAVKTEGQLTVYCYDNGPCYRCLFPQPPPPSTVSNCGDVGVLPQVPGIIGVLQALQVIHIILGNKSGVLSGRMLLLDGELTEFRTIKLRKKSPSCGICGDNPSIKTLIDYEQFCGSPANDKERGVKILKRSDRATAIDLKDVLIENPDAKLIDVRSEIEFNMCRIPSSVNIPLESIDKQADLINSLIQSNPSSKANKKGEVPQKHLYVPGTTPGGFQVFVICRRGNDSQLAVAKLKQTYPETNFVDILGGLHSWANNVDPTFPVY